MICAICSKDQAKVICATCKPRIPSRDLLIRNIDDSFKMIVALDFEEHYSAGVLSPNHRHAFMKVVMDAWSDYLVVQEAPDGDEMANEIMDKYGFKKV